MGLNIMNLSTVSSPPSNDDWFGFVEHQNVADPETRIQPIGNAAYHVDGVKPILDDFRSCLKLDDGTINYYLDKYNKNLKADGTPSDLTGVDGQVLLHIPAHYKKRELDGDDVITKFKLKRSGGGEGYEFIEERFIGTYEGSVIDGKLSSVSGVLPTTNKTVVEYSTYAKARGNGYDEADYDDQMVLIDLLLLDVLNANSQEAISMGVSNVNSTDWNNYNSYNPFIETGTCNNLGDTTGEVIVIIPDFVGGTEDLVTHPFTWRGIENLWGHIYEWRNRIKVNNSVAGGSEVFICKTPLPCVYDSAENWVKQGNAAETDGYIKKMIFGGILPAEVGGGSTTYVCDYAYTVFNDDPTTQFRAVLVSGYAHHGASCGVRLSHAYHAFGFRNSNIGSRLCWKESNKI